MQMLAIDPSFTRQGLGFDLLKRLMIASAGSVYWLLTPDADTPARRLFRRMGYHPLAVGPEAPNGDPGVILVHG